MSYLQPAELRPSLLDVMVSTAQVVPYLDLFQHASTSLLRRMRRFENAESFLDLLAAARHRAPASGVRSNFIIGYPGETDADVAELEQFLVGARLDAIGVFGHSDEEGTEAATAEGKLPEAEVRAQLAHVTALAEQLTAQRAEDRVGEAVDVLVESVTDGIVEGRAAHQAPGWIAPRRCPASARPWVTSCMPRWSAPRASTLWPRCREPARRARRQACSGRPSAGGTSRTA